MSDQAYRAVAIVGVGAIMPDAPDAATFWRNIQQGRYSISQVSPDRWNPDDYYDPDPSVPDKTYSKIGGWVRDFAFDPFKWRMPVPPKVLDVMDGGQKWAVAASRAALLDYGYPDRPLDTERTAVIMGNAMAGENHYRTALRISSPEYAHALEAVPDFRKLPAKVKKSLLLGMRDQIHASISDITEDTMPGELSNIIAGRVANMLDLGGPNFVTDAACASSFAALDAAVEGLVSGHFDAVLTGGIDRNMDAVSFVKFCKIGALSPDGSRPFSKGANGFVMGEGAAVFLLKRLRDAERSGDKIYAVIRGIGAASDGRGKGITAPNPIGQQRAMARAWHNAGLSPESVGYIEAHGTSTKVGDVVEAESMGSVFSEYGLPPQSVPLGSVKSNIGHLKGAAGAAGLLKTAFALHEKVLPPSVNFTEPNPGIDFDRLPFYVNTKMQPWDVNGHGVRNAGVSSFGFGGTNFHVVIQEHVPGMLTSTSRTFAVAKSENHYGMPAKEPYRGALVLGASSTHSLQARLKIAMDDALAGKVPPFEPPAAEDLAAEHRLAIDFEDAQQLAKRAEKAVRALETDIAPVWKPLASQGVYRNQGKPGKIAFLFPGQGSQYVNMMHELYDVDEIVRATFDQADKVMTPLLGRPLTEYVFVDSDDKAVLKEAENKLKDTTITQPAVLTVEVALFRLLGSYGIIPDLVIGHSLGEYGALVAAGVLPFGQALQIVSARGREMAKVSMDDNGCMAAIFAPLDEINSVLPTLEGYVVLANINSTNQAVIGGGTAAIDNAIKVFTERDYRAVKIPVSHAFHTKIVAPASEPLKRVIGRMVVRPPRIPIVANVTGELYPTDRTDIIDLLGRQVASPVQFVKGIETLYREGARILVEVGPKRVLNALSGDILKEREDVTILYTNHPRKGTLPSLNEALCGLYAAGVGDARTDHAPPAYQAPSRPAASIAPAPLAAAPMTTAPPAPPEPQTPPALIEPPANNPAIGQTTVQPSSPNLNSVPTPGDSSDRYAALGQLFASFLEQGRRIYDGTPPGAPGGPPLAAPAADGRLPITGSVVVSGAALGLPGQEGRVFDDGNLSRILRGEQFIDLIPYRFRFKMANKRIRRLVKRESGATFEMISDPAETIKLAGRRGAFDLAGDFGVPESRVEALDIATQLAIAAGIEALRDAGVPLVMRYRTTSRNTYLPDRWMLPPALADETGVIFCSAFPGLDRMSDELSRFGEFQTLNEQIKTLSQLRALVPPGQTGLAAEIDRRIVEAEDQLARLNYTFDRKFIFRVLAMGHSQFAEFIGARGPNTHVNAACATTTHAMSIAEDWIRTGRCRRVIVIAGDDVTSENLMEWIGSGLLATGATTTEERLDRAALPFDRRRNGTIIGMGAAAIVLEAQDAVQERGMRGITELLASQTANSAYHGTRLDVAHICLVMENLVSQAERRFGLDRRAIAPQTVFVSHETYTPARGGSAAAEIHALRSTFGDVANQVVIANTKGYTGHAMGVGIEDVLAIKALETGLVPPVANIHNDFEPDAELGDLNLSRGGQYNAQYALRLGAGFGSQIAMTLMRRIPGTGERIEQPNIYTQWLSSIAGYEQAELTIEQRTLRIQDAGPPAFEPAASAWQYGQLPSAWAPSSNGMPMPAPRTTPAPVRTPIAPPAAPRPAAPAPVAQPAPQPVPAPTPPPAPAPAPAPAPQPAATLQPAVQALPQAPVSTPAATEQEPAQDPVVTKVLAVVSEKTGYPPDMLDPELDIEADLGIDTVKQAEVFTAIREAYDIPRRDDLKLRDYNTLTKVVAFVHESRPDLANAAPAPPAAAAPASLPQAEEGQDPVVAKVLAVVSEKTGYPPDMLDPELDIEADLGIDTVKQAEVFAAIREAYDIPRRDDLKLRDYNTLTKVVAFVHESRPDLATDAAPAPPTAAPAAAPVAAAAPAVSAPASAPQAEGQDAVTQTVLAVVSEKTGYPPDMLDLELDIEADLGIDTVKQAEVFAAIREAYDIPRREDLKLRDYNTLTKVVAFVHESRPDLAADDTPAPPAAAPVAAAVPAETSPASEPQAEGEQDAVTQTVLAVVSEKTGYPPDMLDLELDIEADLGIDTVKQAEVFAAIREAYDIPRREDLKLRDYNTLTKVVAFVHESRPDLASDDADTNAAPEPAAQEAAPTEPAPGAKPEPKLALDPAAGLEAAQSIPRRMPEPVLRPVLDLCKPTGVEFAEKRLVVVSDNGKVAKYLGYRLRPRKSKTLILQEPTPETVEAQLTEWLAEGPIDGVYFLPALDIEPAFQDMDLAQWRSEQERRVKSLYTLMRALPNDAFLISATRMGGLHGYGPEGASAPLGGAVTGFTKAYARERPDALVKAVDFAPDADDRKIAELLVSEALADPGAVEIGYYNEQRFGVRLVERPLGDEAPPYPIDKETVFVVTGAAGGITATIVADLAQASGGTFYLTDITPAPDPDNPDLARLGTDDKFLKRDIAKRIMDTGTRPTPVMVEKELAALERSACIVNAMKAVESAGGTAHYRVCNVLDADAVQALADEVAQANGHLDVIVHAAGMERSHFLPDKPPQEFNLIYDVKADGLFNLLTATDKLEQPLQAIVVFTSIAGRFGNAGQTDYSAANDLMCKTISSMRTTRPQTRGIATDWSAWAKVGMATRRSIPEMMRRAGIDMLEPQAAAPIVRREIIYGTKGEILVGGELGMLLDPRDPDGGLDLERASDKLAHDFPVAGKVINLDTHRGLTFEVELDPQVEPFLYDHAMDDTPLLPGVMGVEGFAEIASLIASDLGCAKPCYTVTSIEDVDFVQPLKYYRQQPRTATWRAVVAPETGGLVAEVTLESTREIAATGAQQHATHFYGRVHLASQSEEQTEAPTAEPPTVEPPVWNGGAGNGAIVESADIYRVYFHGPAFQVLDGVQREGDAVVGKLRADLPAFTASPAKMLTVPRLLELCLQTAGVWEIGKTGVLALPTAIDRVVVHQLPERDSALYARMEPRPGADDELCFDGRVVDEEGQVYLEMNGYRTARLPNSIDPEQVAPLKAAVAD